LLNADRLQPSVKDLNLLVKDGDYVGYQIGSFVHSLLMHRNSTATKLFPYYSADDYAKALRNGSKNAGVSPIIDESLYLKAFHSDPTYLLFTAQSRAYFVDCCWVFKRKSHCFQYL
jgi:ionotropic glutamate receptor